MLASIEKSARILFMKSVRCRFPLDLWKHFVILTRFLTHFFPHKYFKFSIASWLFQMKICKFESEKFLLGIQ